MFMFLFFLPHLIAFIRFCCILYLYAVTNICSCFSLTYLHICVFLTPHKINDISFSCFNILFSLAFWFVYLFVYNIL